MPWLAKTEPDEFSLADLRKKGTAPWDGVRNYQARNYLRAMQVDDLLLIYHSSCAVPAVVGVARIARAAFADPTQFDPASPYHDPASPLTAPRWSAVAVRFVAELPLPVGRDRLLEAPAWRDSVLLARGSRLSVIPVSDAAFAACLKLGKLTQVL